MKTFTKNFKKQHSSSIYKICIFIIFTYVLKDSSKWLTRDACKFEKKLVIITWIKEHSTGGAVKASEVHASKCHVHTLFKDILSIDWL